MRRRPLFDPALPFPLRLSRRRVELYLECPCCFYREVRLGVKRPSIPAFTLNKAVDTLLKREFEVYRRKQEVHPLFDAAGVNAVPYDGPELRTWLIQTKGITAFLADENVELSGSPDEVVRDAAGALSVVDYKATSKRATAQGLELAGMYAASYVRQLSFYTYLLQRNDFKTSDKGYLLVANACVQNRRAFCKRLTFETHLVSVSLDFAWIRTCIMQAYETASKDAAPTAPEICEYCKFARSWPGAGSVTR